MAFLHANCILLHPTDFCTRSICYQSIWSQALLGTHYDVYIYLDLRFGRDCTKIFHLLCLETLKFQQMAIQLLLLNANETRYLCVDTVQKQFNSNFEKIYFKNYLPAFGASKTLIDVTSRLPEYLGFPILESPLCSIVRSMCDTYSPPIP